VNVCGVASRRFFSPIVCVRSARMVTSQSERRCCVRARDAARVRVSTVFVARRCRRRAPRDRRHPRLVEHRGGQQGRGVAAAGAVEARVGAEHAQEPGASVPPHYCATMWPLRVCVSSPPLHLRVVTVQGMTIERVCINLDGVFEFGQAYVALSRATSLAGMALASLRMCARGASRRAPLQGCCSRTSTRSASRRTLRTSPSCVPAMWCCCRSQARRCVRVRVSAGSRSFMIT
jgi:hypothetical protein